MNTVSRLVDLVNSDFQMSAQDKDYRLTHEQLVKVCKILLHKFNFNNRKIGEETIVLRSELEEQSRLLDSHIRSQMEEVSQLMHTVHQDLENFLKKHKKEHSEINLKLSKLSDVNLKQVDNIEEVRATIEKQATIMTCMLEFSNIEQALAYQGEPDKVKVQNF